MVEDEAAYGRRGALFFRREVGMMADGDVFSSGRKWWKTFARKMMTGDATFEGSAVSSIEKMFRDGNMAAYDDVVTILSETVSLRIQDIDNRILVEHQLLRIERSFGDDESQVAVRVARALLRESRWMECMEGLPESETRLEIGLHLLARAAVEIASTPGLIHALENEPGRDRMSMSQIRTAKERAIEVLVQSPALRQLAADRAFQDKQPVQLPTKQRRPRATVDQAKLTFRALEKSG